MDTASITSVHHLLEPFDKIFAVNGHRHAVSAQSNDAVALLKGRGKYVSVLVGVTCGSW